MHQPPKAVLFDLDDTLHDHLATARRCLDLLSQRNPVMTSVPLATLEERYSEQLERLHLQMLRGEITQPEARVARMTALFRSFEVEIDAERALAEYAQFRLDYDRTSTVVPGSHPLLEELKRRGLRLAIITNNLEDEQLAKLDRLDLAKYFEVLTISEEVGTAKPDPRIFHVALERLSLPVSDVVLIGDSLSSDIAGAQGVSMRCVWLKRHATSADRAPDGVPTIVGDLRDTDEVISKILG